MSPAPWTIGKLTRTRTDASTYWSYCIKFWEGSTKRRVSLGTTDKQAANSLAREFWGKRTAATADTVGQIVDAYLATLPEGKDKKRKAVAWAASRGYWAGLLISQVDADTSADYLPWRKRAANTVRNELGPIRTALNWAASRTPPLIDRAPRIHLPSMPPSTVGHLSKAQFRTYLDACKAPHVALFVQLAVLTGGRSTALLELTWDGVDFDRGLIHLNPQGRVQKANKQRATVPLHDRLAPLLREAKAGAQSEHVIEYGGKPVSSIKKGLNAAADRCGIHATPHMFRHSSAVWMAEDRVPMTEIAAFLGHSDSRVTERVYARFSPDYLRRASKALDW